MVTYQLSIKLLSDTTFGRGDGVAGLVDQEVEHDPYGFPYLRGRTLKGLLSEECDNLIAVLPEPSRNQWYVAAMQLFGVPGSTLGTMAQMHVGDVCLPEDLRKVVAYQIEREKDLNKQDILNSLTSIRRQTAIDPLEGTPDKGSLRSARVVLRDLCFTAPLKFEAEPTDDMLTLLAVGTLALRHLGSSRNRGRGHVQCALWNREGKEVIEQWISRFALGKEVTA
jgi:RAMP superfamily